MSEYKRHHPNMPLHHESDVDSPESIAARMKELYAFERSALDELVDLSRDGSTQEQFEALLDDLTYEALSENEEFLNNIKIVKSHTKSQEEQLRVRDRQRELFEGYRQAVLRQAGLSSEQAINEADVAKQRISALIETELKRDPDSQPHEILQSLGMISRDDNDQEIFSYPTGLFPKTTDAKWLTYLESVRTHLRVGKAVEAKLRSPVELQDADAARRIAHNAVSRDVDELLGLNRLPDAHWDFEDTRRMLAKMRDSKFPTVETGEKFRTESRIIEGVIGEHAIKALRIKLSDLHK